MARAAVAAQATTEDLFACNLGISCPEMVSHLWYWESTEAVACAGDLVTSGWPGVLLARDDPGPDIHQTQSLVILRGDGTVVLQNRERHCGGDAPPCPTDLDNLPWEPPTVQQQCSVVISSELAAACAAGGAGGSDGGTAMPCYWWPWGNLTECTTIDELSCSEAEAILSP